MKTKILIIALLVVVLTVCLCVPVFAYADTSSDEIVNFNQYVQNNYISYNGSLSEDIYLTTALTIGHYYYVNFEVVSFTSGNTNGLFFAENGLSSLRALRNFSSTGTYENVVQATYTYLATRCNTPMSWKNAICIDLTQMFGSNIPTLAECQEIFVSDYYSYNTGTAISLNGLNSYAQGVNDTYQSLQYTINTDTILTTYMPYKFGISYFTPSVERYDTNGSLRTDVNFKLGCYIPFGVNIPSYSNISIYTTMMWQKTDSSLFDYSMDRLKIYFRLTDGSIAYWGKFPSNIYSDFNNQSPYTFYLQCPYESTGIVLTNEDYDDTDQFIIFNMKISVMSNDISTLIKSAQQTVETKYQNYYGVNGEGYNAIFNAGKIAGINEDNPYTFGYLMSSVIESPLNAVLSIFNFDFLGVNFKNVITLILTLCIIIAIVRLFMGGKE